MQCQMQHCFDGGGNVATRIERLRGLIRDCRGLLPLTLLCMEADVFDYEQLSDVQSLYMGVQNIGDKTDLLTLRNFEIDWSLGDCLAEGWNVDEAELKQMASDLRASIKAPIMHCFSFWWDPALTERVDRELCFTIVWNILKIAVGVKMSLWAKPHFPDEWYYMTNLQQEIKALNSVIVNSSWCSDADRKMIAFIIAFSKRALTMQGKAGLYTEMEPLRMKCAKFIDAHCEDSALPLWQMGLGVYEQR
eukprot:1333060-Rhodomonas_salina.1